MLLSNLLSIIFIKPESPANTTLFKSPYVGATTPQTTLSFLKQYSTMSYAPVKVLPQPRQARNKCILNSLVSSTNCVGLALSYQSMSRFVAI